MAVDASQPWYLAQLKPGEFRRAVTNLGRQGFASFMPQREVTRRHGGRWETRPRPLFPGYLFVEVPHQSPNWRAINSTYGVAHLVSLGQGRPTRVAPELIAALLARTDDDGQLKLDGDFQVGDRVRVISGPLADQVAEIETIPERGRIHLFLELMGQYARIALSSSRVERV